MWNVFRLCLLIPFLSVLPMLTLLVQPESTPRSVTLSDVSFYPMEGSTSEYSYAPHADRLAYRLDWSPMGQGLWVCYRKLGHHIHVATDSEEERYDVLALSPDGEYLAFARSTHESPSRRLGVRVVQVASGEGTDVDGVSVAWTRRGDRLAIANPAEGTIAVLDVPSFETRIVARTPRSGAAYEQPSMSWSPGGEKLAYTVHEEGVPMTSLWVLSLGSVDPRFAASDGEGCVSLVPFWSPDGRLAWRLTNANDPAGSRHFVQEADGNVRELGRGVALDPAGSPSWSPGGETIVFPRTVAAGEAGDESRTDLWAMDVETGALRRLTAAGDAFGEVLWSANGAIYLQESARLRCAHLDPR